MQLHLSIIIDSDAFTPIGEEGLDPIPIIWKSTYFTEKVSIADMAQMVSTGSWPRPHGSEVQLTFEAYILRSIEHMNQISTAKRSRHPPNSGGMFRLTSLAPSPHSIDSLKKPKSQSPSPTKPSPTKPTSPMIIDTGYDDMDEDKLRHALEMRDNELREFKSTVPNASGDFVALEQRVTQVVEANTQLHAEKQQAIDRIGDLKGKYETLRVEAKGQHEREVAKILELNKTIKTQFQTIEQQDKRDVNLLRANKGLEAEYASLQESAESDLTHFETTLKPMGPPLAVLGKKIGVRGALDAPCYVWSHLLPLFNAWFNG